MVIDVLSKYSKIVDELRLIEGVRLFALLKMDDITDRWTLLFGLEGAEDLDKRKDFFDKIAPIIRSKLTEDDLQDVARIGLFNTTDHLIKDLLVFPEKQTIKNVKANGNFVHEGYILISKRADHE